MALLVATSTLYAKPSDRNTLVMVCARKGKWVVQIGESVYHSDNKELPAGIRKIRVVPGGAKFWTKASTHPTLVLLGHTVPTEEDAVD